MSDLIVTHEDTRRTLPKIDWLRHRRRLRRQMRPELGPLPPLDNVSGTIMAQVNHGRWVIPCPACNAAQMCSRQYPYYLCDNCGSPDNNGQWRHVVYPDERDEIEAVLLDRVALHPELAPTRNWTPGETVDDLRRENAEHIEGIKPEARARYSDLRRTLPEGG